MIAGAIAAPKAAPQLRPGDTFTIAGVYDRPGVLLCFEVQRMVNESNSARLELIELAPPLRFPAYAARVEG